MLPTAPLTTSVFAANDDEICKHMTLYSLTFHPQKEHMILCHPTGKTLAKQNQANIQFNAGVVAGQAASATKCLGSKDFCKGWNFVHNKF
jgi:hypothetical protein